jgi:hypothetical protein
VDPLTVKPRTLHEELVGGLELFLFVHILGIIIPTDELIFFREIETTNQTLNEERL